MLRGVYAVEDVLVELCSKVAGEAVNLGNRLLNGEAQAVMHAQRLVLTLRQVLHARVIRIGKMPEREDVA